MARLSKAQIKAHNEALALLEKPSLTDDQREFVVDNWQESANHINSAAGAFFTPSGLAQCVALYTGGAETVLDLCAGIGSLALATYWHNRTAKITCVEVNPDYVAVGRKLLPEATWIEASANDLPSLGRFDCVISNPPFGKTAKLAGPRYSGDDELALVDIASDLARWGVFILPNMSCPFEYSGKPGYTPRPSAKYDRFHKATGIEIQCESIDCAYYRKDWRGVSPAVEVVSCDFEEIQAKREAERPRDLFSEAA